MMPTRTWGPQRPPEEGADMEDNNQPEERTIPRADDPFAVYAAWEAHSEAWAKTIVGASVEQIEAAMPPEPLPESLEEAAQQVVGLSTAAALFDADGRWDKASDAAGYAAWLHDQYLR